MSALTRLVEPEWLDILPEQDQHARRSRRDLQRINGWMMQASIMAGFLARLRPAPPKTILELGGGDGTFLLRVARKLHRSWPKVAVVLVDRQDLVKDKTRQQFEALGWQLETVNMDVFEFLSHAHSKSFDLAVANLFLHHFSADDLAQLFRCLALLTRGFVACEPRRSQAALLASRLLWTIGCNNVTRHDAVASVRAGFDQAELSSLWPATADWELIERGVGPFTHCFWARLGSKGSI